MTIIKKLSLTACLTLLPVYYTHSFPVDAYLGAGLESGYTESTFNDPTTNELGFLQQPSYSKVKNDSLPYRFYIGFRFHPNYAIEMGYQQLQSISFVKRLSTYKDSGTLSDPVEVTERDAKINAYAFYLSHVLHLNLTSNFSLFAKAGLYWGRAEYVDDETLITYGVDTNNNPATSTTSNYAVSSKSIAGTVLSAGTEWRINPDWSARFQVEQQGFRHRQEHEKFVFWHSGLAISRHF